MKKTVLTAIVGLFLIAPTFAQLSTRQNDDVSLKLGARPKSGDMSLTFAMPLTSGGNADLPIVNTLASGDFISFKYYLMSDVAIRAAINLSKDSEKASGDLIDITNGDADGSTEFKNSMKEYTLVPGIEKHFSSSNIFDVYTGADLFLGIGQNVLLNNATNAAGDYNNTKSTSSHMILGLGGVIGINVFVAQLPISIGLEYGLNFKYSNEGKTHVENSSSFGGTTTTQDYYTSDKIGGTYGKLKQSTVGINANNNVRIMLNFYFGK